jgi:hypothetical protein
VFYDLLVPARLLELLAAVLTLAFSPTLSIAKQHAEDEVKNNKMNRTNQGDEVSMIMEEKEASTSHSITHTDRENARKMLNFMLNKV